MWRRDAGVQQLVQCLDVDVPARLRISDEEWAVKNSTEKFQLMLGLPDANRLVEAITEQARACADDFSYAARNYFWITTKKKKEQLFSLWESQYLILDKYYEIKAKGRAQKIIIIKARQLGCSRLIEAMIAWRAMFFPNTNAIVVSVDQKHSAFLFGYMLYIYDKMPWWLQPTIARRKEDEGLVFDNDDPALRSRYPGLNSRVMVQWSNQYSGVGQGIPVDCAHVSEFTDYDEDDLESIVNEDLGNSMADEPEVFGFMESTGRGAGSAAHRIWRSCERRLDSGRWPKWYPLFLPSFFEKTRVLAPPAGWKPADEERKMLERVKREWVRCDNEECGKYHKGFILGESMAGVKCRECSTGTYIPFVLSPGQLYWHQDNREQAEEQGDKALKQWKQEQCVTGEEAFQVSGYVMFNDKCRSWIEETISDNPVKRGKIYKDTGEIHGAAGRDGHCYVRGCNIDHRGDETPLWVWEEPKAGCVYTVGVDVSEGIGQDYSVIFVNKLGTHGNPDEQVAVWRDNHTKPKELAYYANVIGLWYNMAMMCVEYNTYQTTGDDLLYVYQYPNIFRWKNKDSLNPLSQKWHWWTKVNTKAYLHQTAVDWLLSGVWVIRSRNFMEETTTYKKEEFDSRSFGSGDDFHDDELMAGMIALYCSHEMDCDGSGRVMVPSVVQSAAPPRYRMHCSQCFFGAQKNSEGAWPWCVDNPENEFRCPSCGSVRLRAESLEAAREGGMDYDELMSVAGQRKPNAPIEIPFDHY